jgi:uncharacterized membrane protein (DUF2068 family)
MRIPAAEVYGLTEKVTAFRLGAFVINVAAVVWLLWSKRLFGLNGGGAPLGGRSDS